MGYRLSGLAAGGHRAGRRPGPGPVRTDNGNWAVPGGGMDLGESITQTAIRETFEETGITCQITGLVGSYTSPVT